MFDPIQLRSLAERVSAIGAQAAALHGDLDAMLPLAVSEEALAAIARWPEADRECRKHMLHALLHLSRASASLGVARDDLANAATGVEI